MIKNPPVNAGDAGSVPRLGRSPLGGNSNPLQYTCLGNSMNSGVCYYGVARSQTQMSLHLLTKLRVQTGVIVRSFIFLMCNLYHLLGKMFHGFQSWRHLVSHSWGCLQIQKWTGMVSFCIYLRVLLWCVYKFSNVKPVPLWYSVTEFYKHIMINIPE